MVMHKGHDAPFYLKDRGYNDFPLGGYDGRCRCELVFWEHYDILVIGFSLVGTQWA